MKFSYLTLLAVLLCFATESWAVTTKKKHASSKKTGVAAHSKLPKPQVPLQALPSRPKVQNQQSTSDNGKDSTYTKTGWEVSDPKGGRKIKFDKDTIDRASDASRSQKADTGKFNKPINDPTSIPGLPPVAPGEKVVHWPLHKGNKAFGTPGGPTDPGKHRIFEKEDPKTGGATFMAVGTHNQPENVPGSGYVQGYSIGTPMEQRTTKKQDRANKKADREALEAARKAALTQPESSGTKRLMRRGLRMMARI